ncbi:murein L,D-transpeptidase catalytic domain family protein [Tellurirhabdus rosea]|uniref:murein L,D-transpeptidase catalytic domain family protein n=1 Tax=Tellurirhabdus rosea TaxID=2674997 RepID=UPI002257D157|nr:murein L,D-transpeptidase catalytic domain family protein [Tellurirhabdus rosea]
MKKILALALSLCSFTTISNHSLPAPVSVTAPDARTASYMAVYEELRLDEYGLRRDVFEYALKGLQKMPSIRPVISIADLSQPSSNKRLYIIDLAKRKLLFNTYVAHGRNSGELNALNFSNKNSSYQSSLGFYQTMQTYQGKHGLSLKLKGLEKGFNDNAYDRAIVIHGADYVCEDFIRRTGRLGRSQGCPAIPNDLTPTIIEAIKGGTCLFLYHPSQQYLKMSSFLS